MNRAVRTMLLFDLPEPPDLVDERQARERLGYARRPDHPWAPLNRQRPLVSQPERTLGERMFGDNGNSTV